MGRSKFNPVGRLVERNHDCVGCGYCCSKVICLVGFQKHGPKNPCPELREHDGRFWCGLIEDAKGIEREELMDQLAIGAGCSSTMFNTIRDSRIANMKEKKDGKAKGSV